MAAIKAAGIENVGMVTEMPAGGERCEAIVAKPDHNGYEQPSRRGYFGAIFISALGHAALFILVVEILPGFFSKDMAPPPAYTVKIVDTIPAGDLGTHLPPIDADRRPESAHAACAVQGHCGAHAATG